MKKLVIIGGGFAGSLVAKALENNFNTTLIDKKPFFEYTPGILKVAADIEYKKKLQVPHKSYLKKTKVIVDEVKSITKNQVMLNKTKIPFDYLVITSGSKYNKSISAKNIIHAYQASDIIDNYAEIQKAKSICVIGGGLVGVELAAELCRYKDKKITLIHSHKTLIERSRHRSINKAERFLKKRNVQIIFNEKAETRKGNAIVTDKGTKVPADLFFFCTGIAPNSEFLKPSFSKFLTKKGNITVNEFLQLENHQKIFAAGDVTAIQEEKIAQTAEKQAKVVINNILALENNQPLVKYFSKSRPLVVSLGKYEGILEYKSLVITGVIPAFMKYLIRLKSFWKRK